MNDADRLPAGHALPGADVRPGDSTIYNSGSETGVGNGAAADDPDATRAEIEQTRARMSETIDEIEEQLLRRKQTLEEKLDVKAQVRERLAPVRERLAPIQEEVHRRPLLVWGGVFGTGLLLGYLTGGDDDNRPRRSGGDAEYDGGTDVRARRWEEQSRRLMRQNGEQEEELRRLRARLEEAERRAARHGERQAGGGWRSSLGSAIGGIFGGLLGQIRGRDDQEEYDVEVEVRATGGSYDNYSPSTSYEAGAYPRRYGTGYSESEYGGTGFTAGGASFGDDDYPQRGFSQGAHYDGGLEDGGYESSTDYRSRSEYDRDGFGNG
jgi:hypothetical protein